MAATAHAKIGETREQIIRRFGKSQIDRSGKLCAKAAVWWRYNPTFPPCSW
jgi:hypothetical protein